MPRGVPPDLRRTMLIGLAIGLAIGVATFAALVAAGQIMRL